MRKIVLLSLLSVLLVVVVGFALWYVNEQGQMNTGNKASFVPANSAMVISVNKKAALNNELQKAWSANSRFTSGCLLKRVVDSLKAGTDVQAYPYVVAFRLQGKNHPVSLYVLENKEVFSKSSLIGYLVSHFGLREDAYRKYEDFRIYTLVWKEETIYFAICGGITLVSDSDLYIEDALKQYQIEGEDGAGGKYDKFFSAAAGLNLFFNTSAFTDFMPLSLDMKKVFPGLNPDRFFKWGALDGEFSDDGVELNGWLDYKGADKSCYRIWEGQRPDAGSIETVLPSRLMAVQLLRLTDVGAYMDALERFRSTSGDRDRLYARKKQFAKMFGKDVEKEMRELLMGEFAAVDLSYDRNADEYDGLVVASMKSGSLCSALLEKMMDHYAAYASGNVSDLKMGYGLDKGKEMVYYRFPAEDWASVYWGNVFRNRRCPYAMVVDNYLVFASSVDAVKEFVESYLHGNFIADTDWYARLTEKLSQEYNFRYLARTEAVLPGMLHVAKGDWKRYLERKEGGISVFPSFAMQWSNEGDMLYHTLSLNTLPVEQGGHAHLVWQTRLDAPLSMKPVSVENHNNGEKEIFVQDKEHSIYLLNEAGRILWKKKVGGQIRGEVYQVDLYRNGKLQYLFSTREKIYLVDRNGNDAGAFPVALPSPCERGITLCDYDRDRNYRIFVPCEDRNVYLYGLDGKKVEGWAPRKTDKQIVTRVRHFRVSGKDYIVFADRFRFYVLDRRGRERVKVSEIFDLPEGTELFEDGETIWFASPAGGLQQLDFRGNVRRVSVPGITSGAHVNMADLDGDGNKEVVCTADSRLSVWRKDGTLVCEKDFKGQKLAFPYIYRFSATDRRIGLLDENSRRLSLVGRDGEMAQGFPISGLVPISIVFSGAEGFYLYTGLEDGNLVKYRVAR